MWIYIFLHQLVYEIVASTHPDESGFVVTATLQSVETAVNKDLNSLLFAHGDFTATTPDSKQRDDVKAAKVHTSHFNQLTSVGSAPSSFF
jgi:hypothetical protein